MKTPALPPYELRTSPVPGTFYRSHAIVVAGQVVHSQMSPYSADEITERVRAHLHPPKVQHVREFYGAKTGPKPLRVKRLDDDLPPEAA